MFCYLHTVDYYMFDKKKCLINLIVFLLWWIVFNAVLADDTTPRSKLNTNNVDLYIDLHNTQGKINRNVLGIGLVYQPIDKLFRNLWSNVFENTSGRIWMKKKWFNQNGQHPNLMLTEWASILDSSCTLGITHLNGFMAGGIKIHRQAEYVSETNNNLDTIHQPSHIANTLFYLKQNVNKQQQHCHLNGWEVWNEPQFPKKGQWYPEDMARYAIDLANAFKNKGLKIDIGVPLHEKNMEWNRTMLSYVEKHEPKAIQFVTFHPYSFSWKQYIAQYGTYYSRVFAPEITQLTSIKPKKELVEQLGHGQWGLVASEWNIHHDARTKNVYHLTTDIATAIYALGMIKIYLEEGVSQAQFFQLRGRKKEAHFHLSYREGKSYILTPVGHLFRLVGNYFKGEQLATKLIGTTFSFKEPELTLPFVFGLASYDVYTNQLVIILANRHKNTTATVNVVAKNIHLQRNDVNEIHYLTSHPESTQVQVFNLFRRVSQPIPLQLNMELELQPHSFAALILSATR